MRPADQVRRDLIRQWITKAEEDLGAAEILILHKPSYLSAVGFHCQQAAEKFLKALLTLNQIEFPKTHDLGALLDLVSPVETSLAESLNDILLLNPYGVEIRYPGDMPNIELDDAQKAIEIAQRVQDAVLKLLPPDTLPRSAHPQ
jgi:HEPN domain-containing protein